MGKDFDYWGAGRPTCLGDLMDEKLLAEMIADKYIRVQEHPTGDLRIYNYAEKAVFEKLWNKATLTCRGLIANQNGFIVARPWEKFFNYSEKPDLISEHDPVQITDKMDGSLGIGYHHRGRWRVATRGSFMSDQAVWATNWLRDTFPNWNVSPGYTPLWEIIYPENRIVLNYGDRAELVLLGCVDVEMGHYFGPWEANGMLCWPGRVAKVFAHTTISEFMSSEQSQRENAEGVVVRSGCRMVKIKQDDYCRAHAIVTGVSNRSVWEALSKGEGIPEQASFMPDEFYQWLTKTAGQLVQAQADWKRQARGHYNAVMMEMPFAGDRKDFARLALQSPFSAALFKTYDGQSIDDLAWKAVRPEIIERPFNRPEATA